MSRSLGIAFELALASKRDLHEQWIGASSQVGSRLPNSLLMVSIQRAGRLDAVLRCLEEEFEPEPTSDLMGRDNQFALSELWVGSLYEIVRLLQERAMLEPTEQLETLAYDLRLLRIPIEKHEIAGDRRLEEPLILERHLPKGDAADLHVYSKEDALRAHIMPVSVSQRGSAMWHATDLKARKAYWIERLSLSERALSAFLRGF